MRFLIKNDHSLHIYEVVLIHACKYNFFLFLFTNEREYKEMNSEFIYISLVTNYAINGRIVELVKEKCIHFTFHQRSF